MNQIESITVLSSDWAGLSEHLLATFYPVKKDGSPAKNIRAIVKAPLTESSLDVSLGWQSPFEQMSSENKAPTLFAMLQSGALEPFVNAVFNKKSADTAQQKSTDFLKQFEGRTGITKLNSVQVFSGMPPLKLPVTALFRARADPANEVEAPINQLMKWALPRELAADHSEGLGAAVDDFRNADFSKLVKQDALDALLPSKSPPYIGIAYKNRIYAPMVIESITLPLNSPINVNGEFTEMVVAMTICSLAAWDRRDWRESSFSSQRIKLASN